MYSMLLCGQFMYGKFPNSYIVELGSKILCILCYYVVNIMHGKIPEFLHFPFSKFIANSFVYF